MNLRRALQTTLCTALCGAFGANTAAAQANTPKPVVVVIARWVPADDGDVLVIPLADALTEKQKNMITGGFTTVSQLSIRLPAEREGGRTVEVFNSQCSVKFDAWEETYEVVKIRTSESLPHTMRHFSDYSKSCLTGDLVKADVLDKFAANGGHLYAQLSVKQTSVEEAEKIKEWLIQQQSGLMQSLFSHMLGDISLQQTEAVHIQVPPKQGPQKIVPASGAADKGKG